MIDISGVETFFLDFDGAVKESTLIKTQAFRDLFTEKHPDQVDKIEAHHIQNSGTPRSEKIQYYLTLCGLEKSEQKVKEFSEKFSELVVKKVINSEWVPGVLKFLEIYSSKAHIHIVTATPQDEIRHILKEIRINRYLKSATGWPTMKATAMATVLAESKVPTSACLMIGDSESDLAAAVESDVPFLLRRTSENSALQQKITEMQIDDFRCFVE